MNDLMTLQQQSTTQTLCVALELSSSKWRLAFHDGSRVRDRGVDAGDLASFEKECAEAKRRFGLPDDARVISCYEAGRDGFWIHRELIARGVTNHVVDSAAIEVNRKARRAKTDKIDARQLVAQLRRYVGGETKALHVIRVPTVQEEDARRPIRERDRLLTEKKQHIGRITSLLALHGLPMPKGKNLKQAIEAMKPRATGCWSEELLRELQREVDRLELVKKQLAEVEARREDSLKVPSRLKQMVTQMMLLCGVGPETAWILSTEFFSWREFKNRRQVGAAAGLAPTPFNSGGGDREQGISKAGNPRVRALLVEVAWCWLRYQPESDLAKWFADRFGTGARVRRIGIVALARKLVIALWRYVKDGLVPEGAKLKTAN